MLLWFEDEFEIFVEVIRVGCKSLIYGFEFVCKEVVYVIGSLIVVCCCI